ncbi:hypothetical protein CR513_24841, partial [Mucuna pruriens]
MAASFNSFTFLHVPRDQNERADLLAKLASTQRRGLQWLVIHENLSAPTIDKSEVQHNKSRETWMDPIIEYLKNGKLLEDSTDSLKIRKEAPKYTLIEQRLYRRGFSYPLLRCVDDDEALYLRNAYRGRALAGKIARAGYYWLTLKTDCMDYMKKCDKCQNFADIDQAPLEQLHSFTSVEHPQANGQAEADNRVILRGLQRRLEEAKGRWAEECPQVLWSYHTTPHSTTGEMPFRLTYESDAMIPVEIGEPSPRIALFEPAVNEEELRTNLDLLQEVQEIAHIKEYAAKARVARRYDLVLRKATLRVEKNKLTPKWEGPFRIAESVGRGAYRLEHLDGRKIPRTWNAVSLRRQNERSWERNDLRKLQDPKRTTIETDPGSEE